MDVTTDTHDLVNRFYSTQDPALREEVVVRHIPLVHYVLGRLGVTREMGADYEDLISQGLLGLIEAVDHYDPQYGTQFSTYATIRVRGKMLDYMRSQDWLSRSARHRVRSIQQAISDLWQKNGRLPTDQELAEFLEVDPEVVQQGLMDSSRVLLSLDTMDSSEEDEGSLHEALADEGQPDPAELYEGTDTKQRLIKAFEKLPERELLVLSMYYYEGLTLKEIGEVMGVSESRISQLHGRAVVSLKVILAAEHHNAVDQEEVKPQKPQRNKPSFDQTPTQSGGFYRKGAETL